MFHGHLRGSFIFTFHFAGGSQKSICRTQILQFGQAYSLFIRLTQVFSNGKKEIVITSTLIGPSYEAVKKFAMKKLSALDESFCRGLGNDEPSLDQRATCGSEFVEVAFLKANRRTSTSIKNWDSSKLMALKKRSFTSSQTKFSSV